MDLSLRAHDYDPTIINDEPVQLAESTRYLGVHLDSKLNWKNHIQKKREQLKRRFFEMHWMLRAKSRSSLTKKRLFYITVYYDQSGPIVSHYGDLQRTTTYRSSKGWNIIISKNYEVLGTYPTVNYTKTWIS